MSCSAVRKSVEEIHARIRSSFEAATARRLKVDEQVQPCSRTDAHGRGNSPAAGAARCWMRMTMQQDRVRATADEAFAIRWRASAKIWHSGTILNESAQPLRAQPGRIGSKAWT